MKPKQSLKSVEGRCERLSPKNMKEHVISPKPH